MAMRERERAGLSSNMGPLCPPLPCSDLALLIEGSDVGFKSLRLSLAHPRLCRRDDTECIEEDEQNC